MSSPSNPQELFTPFLTSTFQVPETFEKARPWLVEEFTVFSDVINDKKIGQYVEDTEQLNGENWFYDTTQKVRNGYQQIARIEQFPNISTLVVSVPNDIQPSFFITKVWGSATKPCSAVGAGDGDYFSFMAEGDSRVSFVMTDTEVTITTTVDMTAYSGVIVYEYVRDGD